MATPSARVTLFTKITKEKWTICEGSVEHNSVHQPKYSRKQTGSAPVRAGCKLIAKWCGADCDSDMLQDKRVIIMQYAFLWY